MRGIEFMSNDKSLVSFALVSSTWQKYNKDSFDMFIPFVEYYFSENQIDTEGTIVSIIDTKKYLANEFGLKMISNVIEIIFNRLGRNPYNLLTRKKNVYYFSGSKIDINDFRRQRDSNRISQQLVIKEFYTFLDKKNISYSYKQADVSLIRYLCRYGKDVILEILPSIENGDVWNYRIGEFIQYIYEENDTIFEYIKNIAKGGMISSIIFCNDTTESKSHARKKFRNTEIYYDTTLLMHLLGYSGSALQESVKELTKILQEQGADICYFDHNLDELIGILNAYITLYKSGRLNKSYNFDYFIENDVKPEIVTEHIVLIEKKLKNEKLSLKETPDFGEVSKNIDWKGFDKYISDKIKYNNPDRRKNDITSLAAIYRLRKYDKYINYETCHALFVSTNTSLVYHAQSYFKSVEKKNGIPAIVDDTFLTGLVWLKNENDEELPTLKIVADALSSQTLSPDFWTCFLEKIKEYAENNIITEEEASCLKVDIYTKKNLYDVTDGNLEKLDHSAMIELLKRNEIKKHKELSDKNIELAKDNLEKSSEIIQLSQQVIDMKFHQYISKKYLWFYIKAIGNHWLFILCIILVAISKLVDFIFANNILFASSILLSFLVMILMKYIDKKLSSFSNIISKWFYQRSFNILISSVKLNEEEYANEIIYKIKNNIKEFKSILLE